MFLKVVILRAQETSLGGNPKLKTRIQSETLNKTLKQSSPAYTQNKGLYTKETVSCTFFGSFVRSLVAWKNARPFFNKF